MGKFITMNFSGRYVVEPRRAAGKDAADQTTYTPEIAIVPIRLGVESRQRKVIGYFDTETMLSPEIKQFLENRDGKDWLKKLDDKIEKGATNLRLLRPGETVEVNGVDIQPINPADEKRIPKQKRATVLQGPVTASAIVAEPHPYIRVVEKVEDKMLPPPKEKVKE